MFVLAKVGFISTFRFLTLTDTSKKPPICSPDNFFGFIGIVSAGPLKTLNAPQASAVFLHKRFIVPRNAHTENVTKEKKKKNRAAELEENRKDVGKRRQTVSRYTCLRKDAEHGYVYTTFPSGKHCFRFSKVVLHICVATRGRPNCSTGPGSCRRSSDFRSSSSRLHDDTLRRELTSTRLIPPQGLPKGMLHYFFFFWVLRLPEHLITSIGDNQPRQA